MRIHSFATLLAAPFFALFAYILWLNFTNDDISNAYYIFVPILILVVIYVMSPQINWWWWKRNPPKLDAPIVKWLESYSPFYNTLSTDSKENFRRRLKLFMLAKDFGSMSQEKSEMPEDLKGIIGHNAIQLTFGREEFLFDSYERMVAYKHAFPSPQHKFLHTVETHKDDGVIIYSMEHLIPGMLRKGEIYNIGMHGFAEAFVHDHPKIAFPSVENVSWNEIEQIGGFTQDQLRQTTGFEEVEKLTVLITYYADFYPQLQMVLPEVAHRLNLIFALYPNNDIV